MQTRRTSTWGLPRACGRLDVLQDPDIIMVGEIRDLQTAEMAIQAALTWHLRFLDAAHQRCCRRRSPGCSTWGAGLPAAIATAAGHHGPAPGAHASPKCKQGEAHPPTPEEEGDLGPPGRPWKSRRPQALHRPVGCMECRMTGYHGADRVVRDPADVAGDQENPECRPISIWSDPRAGDPRGYEAAVHSGAGRWPPASRPSRKCRPPAEAGRESPPSPQAGGNDALCDSARAALSCTLPPMEGPDQMSAGFPPTFPGGAAVCAGFVGCRLMLFPAGRRRCRTNPVALRLRWRCRRCCSA